ncbi:hypothetical protein StoSoilA2_27400 [Arthrobacter sp. StoSoilA2]|uniref:hypothetical protein n=1 Tax=unclassified Arthrobacter TaxID=235627 RepID=UPI001CC442BB|nr:MULTISPECIES: hypothetical protein [unclassified Arthrobacter]MDR6688591.1 hypothetical protein [Arthrobacter sp. 1088]BCW36684.1 hypothetical protein StoSoilA2_27400 [Arthrobacter sp. StoSoilA2]
MMARRLVIAGICLAVLIAAVALVLDQMASKPGSVTAQSPASSSPGANPSNGSASGSASAPPSGSPTSGSSASGPADGGGDGGTTAKPLEVLPPVTSTPTGLPEPSAPAPLITGPLPKPGTAKGSLVEGWPSSVVAMPAGTTVGSTSISTSGNVLQLTADGIVGTPQEDVLAAFRQSLVPQGFWSEDAPAPDGAVAARFVRGTDTVTVSVSVTGTGVSRFQLLGSLHTTAD